MRAYLSGNSVALALFAQFVILTACATPPPPKPVSEVERMQFHRRVGSELAQQLEPRLSFREEAHVTAFLGKIGQSLADATPALHLTAVSIALMRGVSGDREGPWRDFALPGGRIYLAIGMLRALPYQNEVAAEIAIQLAHLQHEHVLEYFRTQQSASESAESSSSTSVDALSPVKLGVIPKKIDYFGPTGVFAFDEKQEIEAARDAVDILYADGYDPRGLISLWQNYVDHPDRSPYEEPNLRKILAETRHAIAQKAPLRNPIVRTEAFIAIHNRIEKL
jgi:predicted Zn-dependent protease